MNRFLAMILNTINFLQGKSNERQIFRKKKHHCRCADWTIQHVRETMRRSKDIQNGRIYQIPKMGTHAQATPKGLTR